MERKNNDTGADYQAPITFSAAEMADQSRSPLCRLPPELRNIIYGMVCQNCTAICNGHDLLTNVPGLLLACKQTYTETIKMFWSTVTLEVIPPSFAHIAKALPPRYYQMVPALRIVHVSASTIWSSEWIRTRVAKASFGVLAVLMDEHGLEFRSKRVIAICRDRADEVSCDPLEERIALM